jgi:DNA-binding NarL/FixJ family response regulator
VIDILVAVQASLDREGLVALLRSRPDFRVAGSASTWERLVSECRRQAPHVLVLGIFVGPEDGGSAVARIGDLFPRIRVLMIAPHSMDRCAVLNPEPRTPAANGASLALHHESCLEAALFHGAFGAIRRDSTPEELFEAVRAVSRGEAWLGPGVVPFHRPEEPLSGRERAVAALVGRGCSNKEIGATLGISALTVKKHLTHILAKLCLGDRLQLGICVARQPFLFEDGSLPPNGRSRIPPR